MEKRWVFGPLRFFVFGYVKGSVLDNITVYKSAEQLSYGCEVLDQSGSFPNNFQNYSITLTFLKNGLQLEGPRSYFWSVFSCWTFFVPNKFERNFSRTIEREFNFVVTFFFVPTLNGISSLKWKQIFVVVNMEKSQIRGDFF